VLELGPAAVFNLPLSEAFLVLDLRHADRYTAAHLATAWSLPPPESVAGGLPSNDSTTETLIRLLEHIGDEMPPERLDRVVVCVEPEEEVLPFRSSDCDDVGTTDHGRNHAAAVIRALATLGRGEHGGGGGGVGGGGTLARWPAELFRRLGAVTIFRETAEFCIARADFLHCLLLDLLI
jgi:hypothetical protein